MFLGTSYEYTPWKWGKIHVPSSLPNLWFPENHLIRVCVCVCVCEWGGGVVSVCLSVFVCACVSASETAPGQSAPQGAQMVHFEYRIDIDSSDRGNTIQCKALWVVFHTRKTLYRVAHKKRNGILRTICGCNGIRVWGNYTSWEKKWCWQDHQCLFSRAHKLLWNNV